MNCNLANPDQNRWATIALLAILVVSLNVGGCASARLTEMFGGSSKQEMVSAPPATLASGQLRGVLSSGQESSSPQWMATNDDAAQTRITPSAIVELNTPQQLDTIVASSEVPVLLDFYSHRCRPCIQQGKILKEMNLNTNQAHVIKINVDEHPELAQQYSATSIPMLVVIQNGQPTYQNAGLHDETKLAELLRL